MARVPIAKTVLVLALCAGMSAAASSIADAESATGWDFPPDDQVMLVEPDGRWHLHNPAGPDRTFWYGVPGDVPLLGDWDGDGVDTPGMYRPATGFAYLTNTFPPDGQVGMGDPGLTFFFGASGDQVFSGDWDGDGVDTLGIFRAGKVFLTNTNATGLAEHEFWFGAPGDIALGGDGDNNGIDSVFVFRPSSGFIFHTNTVPTQPNAVAPTAAAHFFGIAGDKPVIGDWNNDRTDTAGVFRPATTTVYLRDSHTTGPADELTVFGEATWTPVAGRVGDFLREIIVHPVGTDLENGAALRDAAAFVTTQHPTPTTPWTIRIQPGTYDVSQGSSTPWLTGLDLPDHTSLIGPGPDQVALEYSGYQGVALRLGEGSLRGFRLEFQSDQGAGISLERGTLEDVHVTGRGTGASVGTGTVIDSSIEVAGHLALNVADGDVIDSRIDVYSENYLGSWGIRATSRLSVERSEIRSHGWGSSYRCVGIYSTTPDLTVRNSTIEACAGFEELLNTWSAGIRAPGGTVDDSTITGFPHPIEALGPMTISDSTLAGGPVTGDVACDDVFDGFGVWFGDQCPGQPYLFRVNAGGPFLSSDGPGWTEDTEANPSQFGSVTADDPGNTTAVWPVPTPVPISAPHALFQTERWDAPGGPELHWNFPVGYRQTVEVRLYFASGYPGASDLAQRLFDVSIDGAVVLDDYDIVADVGHAAGVMKRFIVTADVDGLDIILSHLDPVVQNPLINGIEILVPEHLTVLEADGTPLENGAALRNALATAAAADPGPGTEQMIKLAPGTYEIAAPLELVPYVIVEGSGRNETIITRSLVENEPDPALIIGADHAELRLLQLLASDGGFSGSTPVILTVNASPTVEAVDIVLRGASLTGVRAAGGSPRLRDVAVTSEDTIGTNTGFRFEAATPRLANLHADVTSNATGTAYGLWAEDSDFALSHSRIVGYNDGWGGTGIRATGGTIRLEDVYAEGHGGWFASAGVSFGDATVTIDHSTITSHNWGVHSVAAGFANTTAVVRNTLIDTTRGEPPIAVSISGGDVHFENVTMRAFEATYGSGRGVNLVAGSAPIRVLIEDSSVSGPTWTINNESTTEVVVRDSVLAGGPVIGSGPVTCLGVTDEHGTYYPNTCPD